MNYKYIIISSFLLLILHLKVLGQNKFPIPTSYVSDWEGILTQEEASSLHHIIDSFEKATTHQIGIVTVNTYHPYSSLKDMGKEIANDWGLGSVEKNNGLLISICIPCREVSINTGWGAEKYITDNDAKAIIKKIIPYLKAKQYYTGLKHSLYDIFNIWKKEE